MPDSDPIQDNARDTPNLPVVVKEGEVLRPASDGWLMRAIRTLFGWRAGSVRADLQVVLETLYTGPQSERVVWKWKPVEEGA